MIIQNQQMVCFQSQAGIRASVIIRELDLEKHLRQLRLHSPEAFNMETMTELAKRSSKPKLIRATRLVSPLLEEERGEFL
jgi:hypothetical protein